MQPIQQLLSRLRWDPRFRAGRIDIGYYDRLARGLVVIALESIHFPRDARYVFECMDADGIMHRIPFHRVRRVWRDGRVIWARQPPPSERRARH
jgi:uncharacterized protein (UPF0248 family)